MFSYFSLVPLQFPSLHALNKNGIFLIFNGLLVFLAKTSGLVPSSLGFDLSEPKILVEIKEALLDKEFLVPNGVVEGGEKEAESELLNVDGGGGGRGVGGGGGRGRGNYHFEDGEEEPESELLNVDGSGGGNCHFEDVVKETDSENGLLVEEILVQNDAYGEVEEEEEEEEEEESELLNVDGSGRSGGGGGQLPF
ncbi:Uncharacterized protein Adt_42762 [Abeliophyllum distichum]|uniref:Uncharacterized protein n=1 Tax=Abeliophyllum distichum TaxID=126358 RepID=A0ABD1PSK7_9LAMI